MNRASADNQDLEGNTEWAIRKLSILRAVMTYRVYVCNSEGRITYKQRRIVYRSDAQVPDIQVRA